jgi:carbonic anhydrase
MTNPGVYSQTAGFEEKAMRRAFRQAIPLRTLVVYCPDPRAAKIPEAVAREFGEVWPGEILRDEHGRKIGATNNIGQAITVGGRAIDALRSITTLHHMLGLRRVVVVHHTFCGTTAFTPQGLYEAFAEDEGTDLHGVYDRPSLTIDTFEEALRYDVELIRRAPGTPRQLDIHGFVFDIDTEELTRVVDDFAPTRAGAG